VPVAGVHTNAYNSEQEKMNRINDLMDCIGTSISEMEVSVALKKTCFWRYDRPRAPALPPQGGGGAYDVPEFPV